MKIEPFLVASTISIAIGQRLVRMICNNCKEEKILNENELERLLEIIPDKKINSHKKFFHGKGCASCNHSGYIGRVVINEVLVADEDIREAIIRKASASEIKNIAIRNGMTPMIVDGIRKAMEGLTTIEEVLRVI